MYKGLVTCRAGMGSSIMLKTKMDGVIRENDLPIKLEQAKVDAVPNFKGELIISFTDVANDLKNRNLNKYIIGIKNMMDKDELLSKLNEFLDEQEY